MELALLSLQHNSNLEGFGTEQVNQLHLREELPDPAAALSTAADAADSDNTVDRFAAVQAMHLGVKVQRQRDELLEPLRGLGVSLLRSVGSSAAHVAGEERAPAAILVDILIDLTPEVGITDEVVNGLVHVFGPRPAADGLGRDE